MTSENDIRFMLQAVEMARRGLGRTWPNPSVGCVIVKDGYVIAQARTADGGRPHAEVLALKAAGANAKGSTIYVTLEPCSHHGKTPPCVEAIINAAPERVVIGVLDVNPLVNGRGIEALKVAGIDVAVEVLEKECHDVTAGFFKRIQENRPLVTLKIACSQDDKIAQGDGKPRWITGVEARAHVHQVRSMHDAIMVGIGTVLADDPQLTTRVDGIVHKPVRIVLDSALRLPLDSHLVKTAKEVPLWVFCSRKPEDKAAALAELGARVFLMDGKSIKSVLGQLSGEGITRLLVEGGPKVLSSFMREEVWDEFYLYRAPCLLGDGGIPAFSGMAMEDFGGKNELKQLKKKVLGQDLLEIYVR